MKEIEKKQKHTITKAELGNYLRQLANALEGEAVEYYADLKDCLGDYLKIDLKIRRKSEAVVVKLKVKSATLPSEVSTEGHPGKDEDTKPKYKTLKKRMKSTFKAITESISVDEFPDAQTVKSFIADSELMISYPGYGDEYYASYRKTLEHFAQAFENRDWELVKQFNTRLKQLRNDCHERYK